MPDKIPAIKGGVEKLIEEFKKLKYPPNKTSMPKDAEVAFIIDANGKLSGKRIVKNIQGTDVAKQMLLLIDNVKWVPAICNNENVPFLYTIPFRINGKQK
ncbi:MAG TPA: hypothetical protein VNY73_07530 [Bacteroidia bacterium]|nr:hypothetical protein [Bacteroidia bacterium]